MGKRKYFYKSLLLICSSLLSRQMCRTSKPNNRTSSSTYARVTLYRNSYPFLSFSIDLSIDNFIRTRFQRDTILIAYDTKIYEIIRTDSEKQFSVHPRFLLNPERSLNTTRSRHARRKTRVRRRGTATLRSAMVPAGLSTGRHHYERL